MNNQQCESSKRAGYGECQKYLPRHDFMFDIRDRTLNDTDHDFGHSNHNEDIVL